jgi:hypothetical protein
MILSTAICHFPRCDFLIIPGGVGFVAKRGERTSKVVLTEEGMTIDGDVHPDPTPIMDPFLQPFLALMNPQSTGQINTNACRWILAQRKWLFVQKTANQFKYGWIAV